MKGKVKFYNGGKKFGFVIGEDDQEYFFHASQILGKTIPKKDDTVKFAPDKTEKGLQATNVVVVGE